ncbi:hypothetical protein VSR68_34130 [Paraburkholderia phymatum]|uniref:hypothetical protein n=1 Tax=Paraburkholderia phymatum TaxID=148447 RepID=UPI00317EE672
MTVQQQRWTRRVMISPETRRFARTLTGCVLSSYGAARLVTLPERYWALITTLIVVTPPSLTQAIATAREQIIGACIGAIDRQGYGRARASADAVRQRRLDVMNRVRVVHAHAWPGARPASVKLTPSRSSDYPFTRLGHCVCYVELTCVDMASTLANDFAKAA